MKYLILLSIFMTLIPAKELTVQQLFNVQTVKVQENSHVKSLKSFGFVKVDDARVYDVASRFSGYVEKLYANSIYKFVKKGTALAKVYSPEVLKAKDEYVSSVHYAKNKNMIQSAKKKLELLKISSSEINAKIKNRTYTTIVSPIDGYIFKKNINNNAAFNAKQVLFEIVNLDVMWVEVQVHQNQLHDLQNIKTFTLESPALTKKYKANFAKIYPIVNENEESFTLRLEVANTDKNLRPGMYMSVTMNQKKQSYLTLPSTAVIRKNGQFYVFVVGEYEGEYEPLQVKVEVLNPDTYIIKSGLSAGNEVVNNALFMMDSDAQINGLY